MVEVLNEAVKVHLFIKCSALRDVEIFSKSDPFVEVFERARESRWNKVGQTEVIWDNLNPEFVTCFELDYYFEEQKYLQFKVFDAEMKHGKEIKGVLLGEAETTLGEIAGVQGHSLVKDLTMQNGKVQGVIILRIEEVNKTNKDVALLKFSGVGLKFKHFCPCFSILKPMFYLERTIEDRSIQKIYCSQNERGSNPDWKEAKIPLQKLCNGDYQMPIIFSLYDYKSSGSHSYIGEFEFSISSISEGSLNKFSLINSKTRKNIEGEIKIRSFELQRNYSFLDYIEGGCQINLMIGVDFTSSNGNPSLDSSLHYIRKNGYNDYQQALHAVSEILLQYDSDKLVPLYGYGAAIDGVVSHCFPLNFNYQDPNVFGITGIMNTYKNSLRSLTFKGPTLFAPLINLAVSSALEAQVDQQNQQYFILLILTDGQINDMQDTIDGIVRGSNFPLSIVIVGIGNDEFQNMDILDADEVPLVDRNGVKMARDIVQFVPFKQFGGSVSALAKEVLAEIPREIVNFFKMKSITPNEFRRPTTSANPQYYSEPIDLNKINFENHDAEDDQELNETYKYTIGHIN